MEAQMDTASEHVRDTNPLTRREIEVVRLVAEGLSCREAARRVSRSPRTIENHLRSVYQKLHVRNRVELVRAAEQLNLLTESGPPEAVPPASEMELKGHAMAVIQAIDHRLAYQENHNYFGVLSLTLAETFGTRWAGITEISRTGDMLDIIAFAADGELGDYMQCPRDISPCDVAIHTGECVVWEGLAEQFPEDEAIGELHATSYVGLLLRDRLLGPVGTLWIMDDKPIKKDLLPLQVLRVLCRRTAAELALAKTLDMLYDGGGGQGDEPIDLN